jgi:hypothetical protein
MFKVHLHATQKVPDFGAYCDLNIKFGREAATQLKKARKEQTL